MNIHFEIKSILGKIIRTTRDHWGLITNLKHPEIKGKEIEVKKCLFDPLEVRKSSEEANVFLYYSQHGKYYICVVVRHLNGDGFIITSYITDKIKEGEAVWKK